MGEDIRPQRRRHARRRGRPAGLLVGAGALALLLAGGLGARAILADGEETACSRDSALTVAASPEIAQAVQDVLDDVAAGPSCADFDVRPVSSAQAAEDIAAGKAPDVWIPDSSTWVDKVDPRETTGQWLEGPSIAKSPIVLAVGSQGAKDTRVASWGKLVNGDAELRMANPDVDTASRLAFHASRVGEPPRIGLRTGSRLIFMSRFAAPSLNKLLGDYRADPKAAKPFPASEQQLFAFERDNPGTPPLRPVMPRKGTLVLDYPWIANPQLAGDDLKAAEAGRTAFGTTETRTKLTKAGFRTSDGVGGPTVASRRPAELTELEPLDRNQRLAAVEQWDILRTDMRMLAVVDVSGSMKYDSPTPGLTRWDVTKGALLKGISIIPAGSQVGGWAFSSDKGGKGQDWKVLAPVRRLDAKVGSGTQRQHLTKIVERSDSLVEGDTGLYDTIWAAYQQMQRTYDGDYVNSLVVFTDGKNDDPNGGLSLNQLLDKIDSAYDAKRPVRIITIGMGEADPSALQQISDESGGTSYIAETPDDIERVFVQALLARR